MWNNSVGFREYRNRIIGYKMGNNVRRPSCVQKSKGVGGRRKC